MPYIVKYSFNQEENETAVKLFNNESDAVAFSNAEFKRQFLAAGYVLKEYNEMISAGNGEIVEFCDRYCGYVNLREGCACLNDSKYGEIFALTQFILFEDKPIETLVSAHLETDCTDDYAVIANAIEAWTHTTPTKCVLNMDIDSDRVEMAKLISFEQAYGCAKVGGYFLINKESQSYIPIRDIKTFAIDRLIDFIREGNLKTYIDDYKLNYDKESAFDSINSHFQRNIDFVGLYEELYGKWANTDEEEQAIVQELQKEAEIEASKEKDEETIVEEPKVAETGENEPKNDNPYAWLGEGYQPNQLIKGFSTEFRTYCIQLLTLEYHSQYHQNIDGFDDFLDWVVSDAEDFYNIYLHTDFSMVGCGVYEVAENWVAKRIDYIGKENLSWWYE